MSNVIATFRENTQHVKDAATQALRAAQSGHEWMFEFRWYRVTDVAFEDGALVIRGQMTRSARGSPALAGAIFSDTEGP